jgi:methionine-rich copper-binding protein CopC
MNPLRLSLAIVLAAAAVVAAAAAVFAHAEYESSTPGRNEVVQEPPARVDVFFTQEVFKQEGNNFVRVFDEQDQQMSDGDGVVDDDDRHHIYAELPAQLAPGRYIVRWMTTSDEDGDTDEGAFCFYVAVEPTAEQQAECAQFDEEEPTATPVDQPATAAGATPTAEDAQPTATAPPADGGGDDGGAPMAAIIGGVIGGVVVLALIAGGAALWLRRSTM